MKKKLSVFLALASLISCLNVPALAEENYEKLDVKFMQAYATTSNRGNYNYGTEKVIDGMTDSGSFVSEHDEFNDAWTGGERNWLQPYVTVNLGGTYDINKLRLNYQRTSEIPYLYGLQASTDGYTWTNLKGYFALNDAGDTDGNAYFDWEATEQTTAAYIKVVSMNGGTFGLTEVEAYGKKSTSEGATTLIRPEQIKVTSSSNGPETTLAGRYVNNADRTFIATGNPKVVLDDEIYRSYWTSSDGGAGTDDWIAFDLAKKYTLSSAVVNYIDTTGYNVDIYTSDDGNEWSLFKTQTFNGEQEHYSLNGYKLLIDLSDVNTRYIKFQKSSAAPEGTDGWKIGNIFFNTKDANYSSQIRYADRTEWFVTGSTYDGGYLENINDGDLQTQVWGFEENGYINIDMGKIQNVSQVVLQGGWWYGQSIMGGKVCVSTDGENFEPVAEIDMLDGIYANTVINFEQTKARYVRIIETRGKEGATWRTAEINIYCEDFIGDPEFYLVDDSGEQELTRLCNGTVRIKNTVQANIGEPVSLIAALYETETNRLVQANKQTKMCNGERVQYCVDLDLSEEKVGVINDPSQFTLKTFLMTENDMRPIGNATVFVNGEDRVKKKKVCLISVDGMRPDVLSDIDEAQEIMKKSTYTLSAQTVYPSFTLPAHISMFNSVGPEKHGTLTNTYVPQTNPVNGICEVLTKNRRKCAFAYEWEELRDVYRPGSVAHSVYYSSVEYGAAYSIDKTTEAAINVLGESEYDFVFVYLGLADETGHRYGWMGDEYYNAVTVCWQKIKHIIESAPQDYLFIISTDHGGHDGIHGTDLPVDMTIPIIILDKTGEYNMENASIKDIAPTITAFFGVEPDSEWEGKSLLKR